MAEQFNKIFVISDLHIGGRVGRRAFREATALAGFIDTVRNDLARDVALVINGDIVDFLADGPKTPEFNTSPEGFIRSLYGQNDELRPVFTALGDLVRDTRNRRLVLQLGNHDIELSLPSAQEAFREALGITNAQQYSRLTFETSGKGWVCLVGKLLVQVVHGNASDPWNAVDHAGLDRAIRDATNAGSEIRPPSTNAGTKMVCHVINKIKESHPFVDLLKPEDEPLMAVLAAVNAKRHYLGLIEAMGQLPVSEAGQLLGTSTEEEIDLESLPPSGPQRAILDFLAAAPIASTSDEVMRRAESYLDENRRVRDLVIDDRAHLRSAGDFARVKWQQLASVLQHLRGVPQLTSLRLALLKWAEDDHSFDFGTLDAIDRRILKSAMPGADVLIAGHTHLPRFQFGQPAYVNTGTWMRVLQLNGSPYLDSDEAFNAFFDVVRGPHSLADLDGLAGLDPRLRPAAVVDENGPRLVSVKADGTLDTTLRKQPE